MADPAPATPPRPRPYSPPGRSSSTWSKLDPDDLGNGVAGAGNQGLWSLLAAASKYEEFEEIDDDDSAESDASSTGPKTPTSEPVSAIEIGEPLPLDGGPHIDVADTFAKLAANDYNVPAQEELVEGAVISPGEALKPAGTGASIVNVLQNEFGILTREGEVEEFMKETDCALLTEATILGTCQLTNFRVTFHASLLSTRPDLTPEHQVIKAGPFVFHPRGLRRKRRRWMELSHNMISVYHDATEEGRARPIRSTLLSAVIKLNDYNPKDPRKLRFEMEKSSGCYNAVIEYDTEESAIEWHKEISTALFNYRQRHNRTPHGDAKAEPRENSGVRICIPLHRIEDYTVREFCGVGFIVTFKINDDPTPYDTLSNASASSVSVSATRTRTRDSSPRSRARELRLLIFKRECSPDVPDIIQNAKDRRQRHIDEPPLDADVVTVDFGPLTFADSNENIELHDGTKQVAGPTKKRKTTVEQRMRTMFAIDDDAEVSVNRAWLAGRICSSGYLLVSAAFLCFWSKSFASTDLKLRFPMDQVNNAKPLPTTILGQHMIGVEVRGHPLLQFGVYGHELRDGIVRRIEEQRMAQIKPGTPSAVNVMLDNISLSSESTVLSDKEKEPTFVETPGDMTPPSDEPEWLSSVTSPRRTIDSDATLFSRRMASASPPPHDQDEHFHARREATAKLAPLSHSIEFARSYEVPTEAFSMLPMPINLPRDVLRGMASRHFVCLTIGSRGDVQPYIALCHGLIAEGHTATIVTHNEYKGWIEGFGIRHRAAGGDPGALMKLSVEHSMFSPQFFKESLGKFRGWLDDLLRDSWLQCQDADVLIESPSAMAGVHIAEALKIPYIRAFTMPWTRTTAYPHAFLSPPVELSGKLNYSTYVLFDNVFWTAMSGQVNRWRKKTLNIKRTSLETLAQTKIPFIYNFSPSVVPKPVDWSDVITISGYWFLDNPDLNWAPSPELLSFIKSAKDDQVPIVYIGFGSITVPHPNAMTRTIIKGVLKAGVRAIISKGWSDRMSKETDKAVVFPPECFSLDKVPHDWLFPQIDAAMHHGGAGTTGASLRAGIPTIIKPWFGDQYFWASRVHKLGAGLRIDNLNSSELSHALKRATGDRVMREKAAAVGEKIRSENGVREAIRSIYLYLDRAKKDRKTL